MSEVWTTTAPPYRTGDRVEMRVRKPWWRRWFSREPYERREFTVAATFGSEALMDEETSE
jgi:hypothetical protein